MGGVHPEDLLAAAVRAEELQAQSGVVDPNPEFARLVAEVDPEELLRLAGALQHGDANERRFHALLLGVIDLPADRRLVEVLTTLNAESNPQVINRLVLTIRDIATPKGSDRWRGLPTTPSALAKLRELARHRSAMVRFVVPGAMSACTRRFEDIADALLGLSHDHDDDVRWSAVFELGAWWTDDRDPRIRARLIDASSGDSSDEVRRAAADGLADEDDP